MQGMHPQTSASIFFIVRLQCPAAVKSSLMRDIEEKYFRVLVFGSSIEFSHIFYIFWL